MGLTEEDLKEYAHEGFVLKTNYFSVEEVDALRGQYELVCKKQYPGRILEKDGSVRSVYGAHTSNQLFSTLVQHQRLLDPAKALLGSDVYVYQFKINAKVAMRGDVWEWHQDFIFWHKEDGIPEPRFINVAIFLDEVNEFNGPLMFIPRSHLAGMIDCGGKSDRRDSLNWMSNLTADLKYSLNQELLADLVSKNGIVAPKGPAGSTLFFNSNIMHGSNSNMSPFDRAVVFVTYNCVDNIPVDGKGSERPDFLVSRDNTAMISDPNRKLLR